MKILYVEDTPLIQEVITRFLRREFPELTLGLADNVDDAVTLLLRHDYDVVISDFNLEGDKTGEALLTWVTEHRPGLKFLFLTSEERAAELHPHTLAKPCSSAELREALTRL